jgi:hypothetical protein
MTAILAAALIWLAPGQDLIRQGTPEEAAAARAAFAPNIAPSGGDWRIISRTSDSAVAMDVAHIGEQGSMRTIWIARAGGRSTPMPGAYALMRLELDCTSGVARPRWFAIHSASGATALGFESPDDFETYEDNSGAARIAATACSGEIIDGPGFPTHQAFAASIHGASADRP